MLLILKEILFTYFLESKRKIWFFCCFFCLSFFFSTSFAALEKPMALLLNDNVPSIEALAIGIKIWDNECSGNISGLMSWNYNEDFASLGIGHFIWFPEKYGNDKGVFPDLIQFIRKRGVAVPKWLDTSTAIHCPWNSREEFLEAKKSHDPRFVELQNFLAHSVALQVEYLMQHFKTLLPQIIAIFPPSERIFLYDRLTHLLRTPAGVYALIDYMNFKGDGLKTVLHGSNSHNNDWGLVQVLDMMRYAPAGLTPLQEFTWAARRVLIRRVYYSHNDRHEEIWLPIWLRRVDGYNKT